MTMKLFLDEDLHVALTTALQKRGYDAVHVNDLNRRGKSDEEQLKYAVEQGRCLVSYNVKDFVLLHYKYVQWGQEHFGIIVSKQLPIGQTLQKLLRVLQRFSGETMKNRIEFL